MNKYYYVIGQTLLFRKGKNVYPQLLTISSMIKSNIIMLFIEIPLSAIISETLYLQGETPE